MPFLVAWYFSANFSRFRCCRFVHQARRLARNDTPRVCLRAQSGGRNLAWASVPE
jgi:hypothetical protein